MTEEVPPRVLAAERRREFQQKLEAGSLGCPAPWPGCGHMLADHAGRDDYNRQGMPGDRRCQVEGCDCTGE